LVRDPFSGKILSGCRDLKKPWSRLEKTAPHLELELCGPLFPPERLFLLMDGFLSTLQLEPPGQHNQSKPIL
jgi:hypothetical protein